MTSPVKRALDFELQQHTGGANQNGSIANGSNNKRRCTNFSPQSRSSDGLSAHSSSPFRDPSSILNSLNEDVVSMIKEELYKADESLHCNGLNEQAPVLSIRQTQIICEKLIKDREQKLREEYDRILTSRLEQYDLIAKANYINSFVEARRMPQALSPTPANPSINAIAAALTNIQRSASAAPPIPDLSTIAASLSANSHTSALTQTQLAFNLQQQAAAAALQARQRIPSISNNQAQSTGPVLLASNLDEQLATPEALFTLFGVFGDVVRVKILFNKKDNALIQMADANQAQVAQGFLDKQRVFGKSIRVTRSKHQLVQMPREGNQSDAGLTKDFTNSPLHRFKIPGSRNYLNIYPPSNTLHISNIPATIEESDLCQAFKDACGFGHSLFKFFAKDRKMALMKFNSIEEATIALIKMHNFQISEENNLRVSFSKPAQP